MRAAVVAPERQTHPQLPDAWAADCGAVSILPMRRSDNLVNRRSRMGRKPCPEFPHATMILVRLVAVLPTDHEAIKPNNHDTAGRVALILDVGIFQLLACGGWSRLHSK